VSKPMATRRLLLRTLATIFGVALLTYLIWRVGPGRLVEDIATLGWGLALVIALGGVAHVVKAWAWRFTLVGEEHKVSFSRLLQLRLASEAVGTVGALGQLFGEGLRISSLSSEIPAASRISSVTLDRGLFIATGAMVSLAGIVAALLALSLTHALRSYAALFAVALISLLLVIGLAVRKRWLFLSCSARAVGKFRWATNWLKSKEALIESVETRLFDFYHHTPRAFWASLSLNLVCHGMAVLEVFLVLWLMGVKIGLLGALIFEALTKLVNVVGTFNPGNIGTYEGGNMLIAKMFGLASDTGLVLGISRRLRAILWAAVGGLCLIILSRDRRSGNSENKVMTPVEFLKKRLSLLRSETVHQSAGPSPIALILADSLQEGGLDSFLSKVGSIPVVLRAILGLQKAGVRRIVLCVDSLNGSELKRALLATRRLPPSVEWFEATPGSRSLPALLRQVAGDAGEDHLLVVAGNTTYHPALLREIVAWNRESDALALTSGDRLVGICALSPDIAIRLAEQCSSDVETVEQVHALLISMHAVQDKPVQEEHWQRVLTPEDRISAEQKLDHWLVKPTDGIFARMNRRISIPMSRQMIRWPITPNMVSLFTLGVGFASGVFFACGGYWNVLVGAVLSVWASILDGCDGEVARLKLQESDFGCWLETICDYLYYLFIFSGIAIGMVRSFGATYLVWTGLLLFGAVTSFLVTGAGRHRFAGERPEQYLKIWQAQAESRRSNPILYIGRHTEFIIRRCFMPYALLFFAAINMMRVAFVLSAIGANMVWPISLYSYRTFVVARAPSATSSAAPV